MLDASEYVFGVIFMCEFFIKMIGMGFVLEKGSYLRDGWNILDFTVVASSITSFLPVNVNLSAFRLLRMMRPLRSLNSVEGLKIIISAIIDAIP